MVEGGFALPHRTPGSAPGCKPLPLPAPDNALPQDARKPSDVHGLPSVLVRMIVLRFGVCKREKSRVRSMVGAQGLEPWTR